MNIFLKAPLNGAFKKIRQFNSKPVGIGISDDQTNSRSFKRLKEPTGKSDFHNENCWPTWLAPTFVEYLEGFYICAADAEDPGPGY